MEKEILEGNKLIAESLFGNCVINQKDIYPYSVYGNEWRLEGLKYHSSWDWLIPVWAKLWEITDVPFEKSLQWNEIKGSKCARAILYGTVAEAQKEIAEAIKWYNSNK